MGTAVIFGGTGFIGSFFANHLIEEHGFERVYLFDCQSISAKDFEFRKNMVNRYPQIKMVEADVRKPISWVPQEKIDLVANFAAVHREPGHEDYEYYECNLLGAENVCDWAERVNCNNMIFSSSIAPYGPSEEIRDERSIPVPTTAYGGSKLAAEKYLLKQKLPTNKRIYILRPCMIHGPNNKGNLNLLYSFVSKGIPYPFGSYQNKRSLVSCQKY